MMQAVVIIHGIGEQKPMDTLRSFVEAHLGKGDAASPTYWSKPDDMSELMELRRLESRKRPTTHFYEYYWAYNVEGTKTFDVLRWLGGLILRRGKDVPASAKTLWRFSRVVAGLLVLSILGGVPAELRAWFAEQPVLSLIWIAAVLVALALQLLVVQYLGDAARYLSPRPQNIRLRHTIRSEGLQLLRDLHKRYDRIILVGHSLGSVIGYDLITRLWQEHNDKYPGLERADIQAKVRECMQRRVSAQPVLEELLCPAGEKLYTARSEGVVKEYQKIQREAWRELRLLGNAWRISDFITLGSPLSHAMLLLACGREDLESRKRQRELPTCPPQLDDKGYTYRAPVSSNVGNGKRFTPLVLHHAAPFAVTRWTNLYFPAYLGIFGDLVGGPLHPVFGPGIRDIPVRTEALAGFAGLTPLAHTLYWRGSAADGKPDQGQGLPLALPELEAAMALSFLRKFRPRAWTQLRNRQVPDAVPPDSKPAPGSASPSLSARPGSGKLK